MSLDKTLSRLPIKGAVKDITGATTGQYENYLPVLDANNQISADMLPNGGAPLSTIDATQVTVTPIAGSNNTGATVSAALYNITKDGGDRLTFLRASNLGDATDPTSCFDNIKLRAETTKGGIVALATVQQAIDYDDVINDPSCISNPDVPIVPTVGVANELYLKLFETSEPQTIISQVAAPTPTASTSIANKAYVDTQIAALNAVPIANTVWVSPNGSDTTGARGSLTLPTKTLLRALNLAVAGDTICVMPGTYDENGLSKNAINWYFYPGAIINYTGTTGTKDNAIFMFPTDVNMNIYGYGEFIFNPMTNTSTNHNVVSMSYTGYGTIECDSMLSDIVPLEIKTQPASSSNRTNIHIRKYLKSTNLSTPGIGGQAAILEGYVSLIVDGEIYSDAVNDLGLTIGNPDREISGYVYIKASKISGVNNALTFYGAKSGIVECPEIESSKGVTVRKISGLCSIIRGAKIITRASLTSSYTCTVTTNDLMLENCYLMNYAEQPLIYLDSGSNPPQIILNNCILRSDIDDPLVALNGGLTEGFLRLMGSVQALTALPTAANLTLIGTAAHWEEVATLPGWMYIV